MKLNQLRTFVAVINRGSVTAAARQLDLAPSTVSAHIKALESEFGLVLFARTHAGLAPTEAGRALTPYARQTLQAASDLANEASARRARIAGQLRLACSVSDGSFALPKVVARISAVYPDIQLSLSRGESAEIIDRIRDGDADLGIVYGQIEAVELRAHKLGQAELIVALPAAWLAAGVDPIDVISRHPWIQTGAGCPFQAQSRRFFAARGIDPPTLMRVDDNRTRRELIISGMGVSLLNRHEATHPAIAILPSEPLPCDLTLVYPAHRQFDPLVKAARDLILQEV